MLGTTAIRQRGENRVARPSRDIEVAFTAELLETAVDFVAHAELEHCPVAWHAALALRLDRACLSNLLRYGRAFVATVRQTVPCNDPIMGSVESLLAPRVTNGKSDIESAGLRGRRGAAG